MHALIDSFHMGCIMHGDRGIRTTLITTFSDIYHIVQKKITLTPETIHNEEKT